MLLIVAAINNIFMMKASESKGKKISKKVQGLFDGSLIIKTLWPVDKKRELSKKIREFTAKTFKNRSRATSPGKVDDTKDFDLIELVPTIDLTVEQVENLVSTTGALQEQFGKYGAVKLRFPKGFPVQTLDLAGSKRKLTVRQQVLPDLPKGKVREK